MANGVLGAKEHALDVHGLHPVPLCLRHFMRGFVDASDAGIIDDHIDPAKSRRDIIEDFGNGTLAADITVPVASGATISRHCAHQRFAGLIEAVEYGDRSSFLRHTDDGGAPDAERTTSDDHSFLLESVHDCVPVDLWDPLMYRA